MKYKASRNLHVHNLHLDGMALLVFANEHSNSSLTTTGNEIEQSL